MSMIKNLIRLARTTAAGSDDKQFPVQQVSYLGKEADSVMVMPYGHHANTPPDFATLMFAVQGNPENRHAIPYNTSKRPRLEEGETAFFHPLIPGLIITLQANGTALIKSAVSVDVDAPEATFTGNVTIGGNLQVAGDFNNDGTATLGGAGGKEIARKGDAVAGGVITGGSAIHKAT